jgi:uncharacterized protein YkwD
MGRHRRTASAGDAPEPVQGAHRHRRRSSAYVRTGLLGVSAAVAVGAVAVTSGVLPSGDSYSIGGGNGSDQVRSVGTPSSSLHTLGGTDGPASASPSRPDGKSSGPASTSHHPSASDPAGSGAGHDPAGKSSKGATSPKTTTPDAPTSKGTVVKTPTHGTSTAPNTPSTKPALTKEAAAAQAVLTLVNQERGKAGCSALRMNGDLTDLASAFSKEMADEGFFDHTDPAGLSPWDRAAKAGITNLGGENIARGQADATAVMEAWMNSDGHRANILNCDYTTIGIGVHFGPGGPWWTQDFGF